MQPRSRYFTSPTVAVEGESGSQKGRETLIYRFAAIAVLVAALASAAFADPPEDAVRRGDYATAVQIWRPLAEQGDARAQHNLGVLVENGQGISQDSAEAVRWWRLAAAQGYGPSQNNLGAAYRAGRGVEQNYREALRLFGVARGRYPEAEYNLGRMYHEGVGVTRDEWYAARLFRSAATRGVADAQYALALMHTTGRGATLDLSAAARLFQSAAEQGHALAQLKLGLLYFEGRGVPQDPVRGYMWLTLAMSGNPQQLGPEGRDELATARDRMRGTLSSEQVAQAELLVRQWQAAHPH